MSENGSERPNFEVKIESQKFQNGLEAMENIDKTEIKANSDDEGVPLCKI